MIRISDSGQVGGARFIRESGRKRVAEAAPQGMIRQALYAGLALGTRLHVLVLFYYSHCFALVSAASPGPRGLVVELLPLPLRPEVLLDSAHVVLSGANVADEEG